MLAFVLCVLAAAPVAAQENLLARRDGLLARVQAGGSARDLCRLGHVELDLGEDESAARHLDQGIRRALREIRGERARDRLVGACRYDRGRIEERAGRYEEATRFYANSSAARPSPIVSRAWSRTLALMYAGRSGCGVARIRSGPPHARGAQATDTTRRRSIARVLEAFWRARLYEDRPEYGRCIRRLVAAQPPCRTEPAPTDADERGSANGVRLYFHELSEDGDWATGSFTWEHAGRTHTCDLFFRGWTRPDSFVAADAERVTIAGRPLLRVRWRSGHSPPSPAQCRPGSDNQWDRTEHIAWVTLDGRMLLRVEEVEVEPVHCGDAIPRDEDFRTFRFEPDADALVARAHREALNGRRVRLAPDGFVAVN